MCGAPTASDATQCEHCGAKLATTTCPSCFGLIFAGAKFCSHCGAAITHTEPSAVTSQHCPRCRVPLEAVVVGHANLSECPKCAGIWVDSTTLEQICNNRDKQADVLGMAAPISQPADGKLETVRYVPCPVCGTLMNRVNFANCSHVVVDVCSKHGTWFDKDELRGIVEFIRAGGLDQARARQIAELERQRKALENQQHTTSWATMPEQPLVDDDDWHLGLSSAGALLKLFLK